ncbi:MAG: sigma 54-interacting transcriptional regulator [Gammaproteobacteria bacterium]
MTSTRPDILLVDDDPDLLQLLGIRLKASGYEVQAVDSAEKALSLLAVVQPRLVITDLRMQGMDGMALFGSIQRERPTLPVIILTAHGSIPEAVEATRRGVFGYLTKPFKSKELLDWVARAMSIGSSGGEGGRDDVEWRRDIVSSSPEMEAVLERASLAARSEASILIVGESGTGKELVAHAIHRASPRSGQPFVAVNASAIPESLLESELFGHLRGAFTGADRTHKGLFQAADGGTLFLDEIGDMPLGLQVKLLRALQEREVRPVGASAAVPVDIRVISATHRNLDEAVATGQFRQDLYYRLNVVTLHIPPLSERRVDIPPLVSHLLGTALGEGQQRVTGLSPEAMDLLMKAPWPGNVRQLRNVIEQVVALATGPIVPATLVRSALRETSSEIISLNEARDRFELDYLVELLQVTRGNVSHAARLAQRERSKFYQLLRRHHLDPQLFRSDK